MATNYDLQQTGEQVQQYLNNVPEMTERTKDTTIININAMADSLAVFTLTSAIEALTAYEQANNVTYRKSGIVLSYKTDNNKWESKQFQGNVSDFDDETLWEDFGSGKVEVDVDTTNKVFAIKDGKGQDVGTITVGTGTGGSATLTLANSGENGQSFTVALPNLAYNENTQFLEYIGANGEHHNTVKLSNLQIKGVFAETPSSGEWGLGDLILVGSNSSYDLKVYDGGTWQPLGSINNVSLQATQIDYEPEDSSFQVANVKAALDDLRNSDGIKMVSEDKTLTEMLYNEVVFSENEFTISGKSSGYKAFHLEAGETYKLSLQLTGFEGAMVDYVRLYNDDDVNSQRIEALPLFNNSQSLENGTKCFITFTPSFEINYILVRYNEGGDKSAPSENTVSVEATHNVERLVSKTEYNTEIASIRENLGLFDSDDYTSQIGSALIQNIALLDAADTTHKYFKDNYSYYENCVYELYLLGNYNDIIFKCFGRSSNNKLYVRPVKQSGDSDYEWSVVRDISSLQNDKVIELKVTESRNDSDFAVGDIIGYVVFKDIDEFAQHSISGNTVATIEPGAANSVDNCPLIKEHLGYFDNLIHVINGKLVIPYELETPSQDLTNKSVNILFIGNSYTANSVSYVPFILKNICPNLTFRIGVLFLNGGTLSHHLASIINGNVTHESGTTIGPQTYNSYSYITSADNAWQKQTSVQISVGLNGAQWDIISIHQANDYAGSISENGYDLYYAPYIYRIHKELSDLLGYPIKFGWDIIHGSVNNGSYNADKEKYLRIKAYSQLVEEKTCTEIVFPYGTAVENLRTIASLRELGYGAHNNLLVDESHLQSGIGQLAAAYAIAIKIAREAGFDDATIINEPTYPTTDWVNSATSIRGADYAQGSIGVTEENCFLAQIAAIQAVKYPYQITDISAYKITNNS